jgi:uncharacterized protein involved in exopolysaccharide biosynthesis
VEEQLRLEDGLTGRDRASTFTLRDLMAIGFRHQRLVLASFILIFSTMAAFVLLRPAQYEAQMKILVKRERVDPLVTSDVTSQRPFMLGVTEEELNSEVALLRSRDLLTQVVVATDAPDREPTGIVARLTTLLRGESEETADTADKARAIDSHVRKMERQLDVQPLRRSNVIQVTYASPDPERSATVLKTLAERYLDKHLAVHRPGAFDFFETETERYRGQLALLQARLEQQNLDAGVVSVQVERESALQRLGQLEAANVSTEAEIADTRARIQVLEAELASAPVRTTTEIQEGSSLLLEKLYSTLVTYELKRIELLRVFQPSYPPVQEVEEQIETVRRAIASAESSPLVEQTTDRNPAVDYLVAELAKSRSHLAGLRARAAATAHSLLAYRDRAERLERLSVSQQVLVRAAAQAEESYIIYSRKREEARISNALDAQRILNVAIAEEATVPFEPSGPSRLLLLLFGACLAGTASVALAGAANYLDPSFRTPDEVQSLLGAPVLAAFPAPRNRLKVRHEQ